MLTTYQLKATRRLLRQAVITLTVLLLLVSATGYSAAQSTDRNHPTPLKSTALDGRLDGSDTEYFYSFTAGPGEFKVTFDVKASATNAGAELELLDKNARQLVSLLAQGVDAGSERKVETVRLNRRETVIMRLKGIRYGSSGGRGTYSIQLDGAVAIESEKTPNAGADSTDDRMGLPSSGILRIEMEDGSAQEINLRRVRRVIVKP